MNSDDYENVVFEHDAQKEVMHEALGIVRDYIQRHKLILVGGMAIDMALRTKGKKLYPDNKFPDYDFYSPEFHRDAYRIGEILAKKFDGISVISAFHVSTMKVRINFQEVADITYIPPVVYERIPTVEYKGFRVVHPSFQMIDQHRALSLPFEKPPLETIFGRWSKDIKRYDLLKEFYVAHDKLPVNAVSREIIQRKNTCLCGAPALLKWISVAEKEGFKHNGPHWLSSFTEKECQLPNEYTVGYLTDDYEQLCDSMEGNKQHYRAVLDKIPERCVVNDQITVFNNTNNLTSYWSAGQCSNLQNIMCYLLTMGVMYDSAPHRALYTVAQQVLFWATAKYTEHPDEQWLKYLPTVEVFGESNMYDAYQVARQNIDVMFHSEKRTLFTPRNAYPTRDNPAVDAALYAFEPSSSTLYLFDGQPIRTAAVDEVNSSVAE